MGPVHEDIDITWEKLDSRYQSFLANGLGNTVSRIAALCQKNNIEGKIKQFVFSPQVEENLKAYRFDLALTEIWNNLSRIDQKIEAKKPWILEGEALTLLLDELVDEILQVAADLRPFLPNTAFSIIDQFTASVISKKPGMFPRLEK
jgi:methionyl-tRNA synthetase